MPDGSHGSPASSSLAQRKQRPSPCTLLLCDLVSNTQLVERVGDAAAADVLARHDRIARDLLAGSNGLEIDKSDG
jgi:class 3 adenylate cyclase